jgi:hypothetical protein
MKGSFCSLITSAHMGESSSRHGHSPGPLRCMIPFQSSTQTSQLAAQVPSLPCLLAGHLGSQSLSVPYVL